MCYWLCVKNSYKSINKNQNLMLIFLLVLTFLGYFVGLIVNSCEFEGDKFLQFTMTIFTTVSWIALIFYITYVPGDGSEYYRMINTIDLPYYTKQIIINIPILLAIFMGALNCCLTTKTLRLYDKNLLE